MALLGSKGRRKDGGPRPRKTVRARRKNGSGAIGDDRCFLSSSTNGWCKWFLLSLGDDRRCSFSRYQCRRYL